MNGLASGLFTVLPASSTTVRSFVMSKSVPSNVSRKSSMIRSGVTGFSGFTEKRKAVAVRIQLQRRGQQVQHPPLAPRDRDLRAALGTIGVAEAEGLAALRVPIAQFLGPLEDVLRGHEVVGVLEIDLADPRSVGHDRDVIVGDALGGPNGAGRPLARADDLQQPHFARVGDGQGLALVVASRTARSVRPPMRMASRAVFARSSIKRVSVSQSINPSWFCNSFRPSKVDSPMAN